MSIIAAVENAGLGPGDLPDHWATSTTTTRTINNNNKNNRNTNKTNNINQKSSLLSEKSHLQQTTSLSPKAALLLTANGNRNSGKPSTATTTLQQKFISSNNNHKNNSTASTTTTSSFTSNTKAKSTTKSSKANNYNNNVINTPTKKSITTTTIKTICNLPLSSPAAATAAVTVPTTAATTPTALIGFNTTSLAAAIPSSGATPLYTTTTTSGSSGGVAITAIAVANTAGNLFGGGGGGSGSGNANHVASGASASNVLLSGTTFQQQQQQHHPQQQQQIQGNNNHNNIVALQQQQQQQHQLLNKKSNNHNNNNTTNINNNNNLNNNNNNNSNVTLLQQQQKSATTATAANIAAALQRSAIMNAVASPISAANSTATSNRKIRRKPDSKTNLPQSQINKCNNEKRRRELENNYIEQLSEFLQLNKRGDMTSTKPDKAAILNQVVKTYRDICDKGQSRDISSSTTTTTTGSATSSSSSSSSTSSSSTSSTTLAGSTTTQSSNNSATNNNINQQQPQSTSTTRCTRCATDNCSIHPVQQGEVSSTEPPLPEPLLLNGQAPEISAYFEAVEHYISSVGWVLLQVNADGIIESCTQNIRELIGYDKHELYLKPLYMYLYPGDHAKLDPIISNMSYSGGGGGSGGTSVVAGGIIGGAGNNQSGISPWNSQDQDDTQTQTNLKTKRSISTKVRMLVKDIRTATQTTAINDAIDQGTKQKFEEVVLIAAPVKDDGDSASSVLCLITRPEDESPLEMNIQQHVPQQPIEQMTFKLDIHGKILNLDATALREPFRQHLSKCVGRLLQDLCHPQDLSALKTHLRDIQDSSAGVNAVSAAQSPGSGSIINPPISNVISRPFRLRLGTPDVYMHVKANSRLFLNSTPDESDFIMSVQTILNTENDMNSNNTVVGSGGGGPVSGIGSNTSTMLSMSSAAGLLTAMSPGSSLVSSLVSTLSMDSIVNNSSSSSLVGNPHMLGGLVGGGGGMQPQQHNTQTTNVGGPLMTSAVINGTGAGPGQGGGGQHGRNSSSAATSNNSSLVNSFAASPAGPEATSFYSNDPFGFDLEHSSFDMDPAVTGWTDSRPNSRASVVTPVSTPRPPSAGHGFSPAICASPSTPYQLSSHSAASLPSPQSNASAPFGFNFPNFDGNDKDKDSLNNNNNTSSNNNTGMLMGANLPNGGPSPMLAGGSNTGQQLQQPPQQQQHESERLRHLLMNKSHSLSSSSIQSTPGGSDGDDKDHNMLKFYKQGLMNNDDDKDGNSPGMNMMQGGSGNMFKMGMPGGRLYGGAMQKSNNSSNPMLLSLLNEKSEDDDGKGGPSGRQSELMRQLQKDDGHHGHGNSSSHHSSNLSSEDLRCMLKIQTDPATSRKRTLNEPDNGLSAKRPEDRPQSKLRKNNQMLASLLENPPKNPILQTPPQIKTIPDINPSSVNRVSSTLGSGPVTTTSISLNLGGLQTKTVPTSGGSGRGRKQTNSENSSYLTQQQRPQQHQQQQASQQQQQQMGYVTTPEHAFATPPHNAQQQTATSAAGVATSTATSQSQSMMTSTSSSLFSGIDNDSELSKILDSVMEYVADDQAFVPTTPPANAMSGLTQQEINERTAISIIQKSLMVETSGFGMSGGPTVGMQQTQLQQQQQQQPPAYPGNMLGNIAGGGGSGGSGGGMVGMTPQQQHQHQQMLQMLRSGQANPAQQQAILEAMRANANQGFQRPPPMYPARGRVPMNAVATPSGNVMPTSQQFRVSRQQQQIAAAQQKERLLQQQQKQQLLVPESATARNDQLCMNPGINNIGTLLNTTVAPNVSLSRTNLPPDSQLSPNFTQSMQQLQQQLSPGQRSNTPFTGQGNPAYGPQFPQNAQRLSPQQQHQLSQQQQQQAAAAAQQQLAFQTGGAQLSPRQPPFGNPTGGNNNVGGVQSPGMPPNASPQQWATGVGAAGLASQRGAHSLQQVNPMLSAQLQGAQGYNARQFQNQRHGLNSPGAGVPGGAAGGGPSVLQRQGSFQPGGDVNTGFPGGPPSSPSPQSPYGAGTPTTVFQQQQMQRMQRQTSVPQATQHLPAGNAANSSEFVRQELRAVVTVRAQQQTAAAAAAAANAGVGGNGVPGGGGGNAGGNNNAGLRVTAPQSPIGTLGPQQQQQQQQGPMLSAGLQQQQQQQGVGGSGANSSLLNTPNDPFNFDAQDFFGSNPTR